MLVFWERTCERFLSCFQWVHYKACDILLLHQCQMVMILNPVLHQVLMLLVSVNGQTENVDEKAKSDSNKMKSIKTPDSKFGKKKQKTPRKETKVQFNEGIICPNQNAHCFELTKSLEAVLVNSSFFFFDFFLSFFFFGHKPKLTKRL